MFGLGLLAATSYQKGAVLAAGFAMSLRYATEVVFSTVGGSLAERFGARRVQVIMSLMTAFALALLAGSGPWLWSGVVTTIVLRALTQPLAAPLVAEAYPDAARIPALARQATWRDIGAGAGAISDRIAVMNKGEIAQLGEAEELYRRPISVFVARFIGHVNVLEAVVNSVGNGRVEIELAGERHSIEHVDANLRQGQAVTAVVRPESIGISASNDSTVDVAGVLKTCTYLGDKCEYTVSVASTSLHIAKSNPQRSDNLQPGAAVRVLLPNTGIQLLEKERP